MSNVSVVVICYASDTIEYGNHITQDANSRREIYPSIFDLQRILLILPEPR